ncbi:hypothetical protein GN956_G18706 [Arapaima gigas]
MKTAPRFYEGPLQRRTLGSSAEEKRRIRCHRKLERLKTAFGQRLGNGSIQRRRAKFRLAEKPAPATSYVQWTRVEFHLKTFVTGRVILCLLVNERTTFAAQPNSLPGFSSSADRSWSGAA